MPELTDLQRAQRKEFGRRVRELRKLKAFRDGSDRYSQEALAHDTGVHRTYMGSVERGERNVSLDNIYRIAAALGVEVRELF